MGGGAGVDRDAGGLRDTCVAARGAGDRPDGGDPGTCRSRSAALTLARQMLSRLVVPAGSQAAHPSPVPPPLSVSSAGGVGPYTVELHRFVLVREPAAAVHSFLLAHVPAGMSWAGDGLAPGTTNTVTVLSVAYRPRALASGLTNAELGTAAMPAAGRDTLLRADASVSCFAPRSVAEQLTAASFGSVTVTATEFIPQSRTVTRTVTSPAVIGRLVALVNSLPATPYPDVAAMSCRAWLPVTGWYSPRAWSSTRAAAGAAMRSPSTGRNSPGSGIRVF